MNTKTQYEKNPVVIYRLIKKKKNAQFVPITNPTCIKKRATRKSIHVKRQLSHEQVLIPQVSKVCLYCFQDMDLTFRLLPLILSRPYKFLSTNVVQKNF